mgnify:FL=1
MTNYNTPGMGKVGATWEARGYHGAGNVGDLIGSIAGRVAVVCGNGKGVFDELALVRGVYDYDKLVVFPANDVGIYIDRLDHWVTLHSEKFPAWRAARYAMGYTHDVRYHSERPEPDFPLDYLWSGLGPMTFALSGYFAMQIAYIMGAAEIILCGCPGDRIPRFWETDPRPDNFGYGGGSTQSDKNINQQLVSEMVRLPELREVTCSMSGWTRTFLGGMKWQHSQR